MTSLTPLVNKRPVTALSVSNQIKTEMACMAVAELTRITQAVDAGYLMLGKLLLHVKTEELYKHYSEHTQTMSAFLREIDLGIGLSQADHYIRMYKTFGEHMEGRKIAFKRLLLIHPMVKDEPSLVYWLNKAEELPLVALSDEIKESQGKTPTDGCCHPTDEIETHFRCGLCGAWLRRDSK